MGAESARRAPSRINTVEDALAALVRNALDAGARNVFVASWLRSRRYRSLTVIDDGAGIPAGFERRVFEPGVTSKHLDPAPPDDPAAPNPQGSGLSLYHIRSAAVRATVCSRENPTSVHALFDTTLLPERSLQTRRPPDSSPHPPRATSHRTSRSNLQATLKPLAATNEPLNVYYASPSRILATLLQKLIIQTTESGDTFEEAQRLGLEVSLRTVQRVLCGAVAPALPLRADDAADAEARRRRGGGARAGLEEAGGGAQLRLGSEDLSRIRAILEGAARASYLEVGPLRAETRAGAIVLRASVYEPEEIYDDR